MASTTGATRTGGVGSFYAALWAEARVAVARWHIDIIVEVALIAAWFVLRTVADVDGRSYLLWVLLAGAVALLAPLSGLVVFIATSAFFEPDSLLRAMTPREFIVIPLAVGVAVRVAHDRFRWRPVFAVWASIALLAATVFALWITFRRFDNDVQWLAARSWLGNMAAPIILLVAAAWTARCGELRALIVATAVGVVVAVVCLIEHVSPGSISGSVFGWVGFWKDFGSRLAGTVPSPNALSAQLIVPTMVLLAAALLGRDRRLRLVAAVALIPLVVAQYLTFSRAPFLALYAFVVIAAWRFRRTAGVAVLVLGLVAGTLLLPSYLQLRSNSTAEGAVRPGSILVASDELRFRAWETAIRMWVDQPIVGQGYLSYKALGDVYGDPVLGSPHNEWLRLFAEGGVIAGLLGLFWIATTGLALARVKGWLGTGVLAGFAGYVIAATFNNPFLFIRVSAIAFPVIGVGLALAARARATAPADSPPDASVPAPETTGSADDPALH